MLAGVIALAKGSLCSITSSLSPVHYHQLIITSSSSQAATGSSSQAAPI